MPAAYPGVKEPVKVKEAAITADDRAEYFARYTNASLGRVKNLYLKWARLTNAMSPQCQQLNRLFSQCVDGNRIKIPNDLLDPPEPSESSPPFILDALHKASPESIERLRATNPHTYMDSHSDILDLLLSRDKIAISEFELLQIALRWCREHSENILEYAHFFDFSALSDEQQIWFLNHLPVSATTPSLVRNGLLQSELVESGELARFGLDHPKLHWKPVFRSSSDRMGRFISTVCRTLEVFHKKLIVMRVDERLTLALYIPQRVERCSEVQVDTSVRVFALPRSQGPYPPNYRVLPTKVGYRLYCDENRLQLYQRKQSNTWIALMCSPLNDSSYRNESNRGNRRRKKERTVEEGINYDCRISVALDKISGDIQRHVGRLNQAAVLGAVSCRRSHI
jgi:regulator of nonsense transcripts 1